MQGAVGPQEDDMHVGRSSWVPGGLVAILGIAVGLFSSSCLLPTGCDTVLGMSYHPADTTIRVGQSFRPSVRLTTCGGTKKLSPELRYSADDTTIVYVDVISGDITGRAAGHTNARVTAGQYGTVAVIA